MKKIFSILCIIIVYANTAIAQVTISISELTGTKWQLTDVFNRHSSAYYEFTRNAFIWHREDGTTSSYPYYLSATIPTKFDFTKVGVSTKGCYYIEYNDKRNIFSCYAIICFNKSTGKMIHKRKIPEDVIGLSDTVTYILKK